MPKYSYQIDWEREEPLGFVTVTVAYDVRVAVEGTYTDRSSATEMEMEIDIVRVYRLDPMDGKKKAVGSDAWPFDALEEGNIVTYVKDQHLEDFFESKDDRGYEERDDDFYDYQDGFESGNDEP